MGTPPALATAAQQHARYFDHLVELVPARHYHGMGEDERVHLGSMKKSAKAAMKLQFKAQAKENKRAKLDPDAPGTALEVQQAQQAAALLRQQGAAAGSLAPGVGTLGSNATREELQAKLHAKLEATRQQRQQKEHPVPSKRAAIGNAVAQKAKEWRKQALQQAGKGQEGAGAGGPGASKKRKAEESGPGGSAGGKGAGSREGAGQGSEQHKGRQGGQQAGAGASKQNHKQGQAAAANGGEDGGDLQFARVDFGEDRLGGAGKGRGQKKPTKEALLRAAEAKQAELAAASASGHEGKVKVVQEAWKAALSRAGGNKVLDDPKLLRKSIKKDAKRKEKSAKAWQERKKALEEQQDKRQHRRQENLQSRVDKKIEKKKERREKKLLRAGFEGRKSGFIGGEGGKGKAGAGAGKV